MTDTLSASTTDLSDQEFGTGGIGLSRYRFPTGWFIVGFASDLAAGRVKRLHYFGEELVLFRTQLGQIHVLDAYCQHLGANMGGRWAHRFHPGPEPTVSDFGYTPEGLLDPTAAHP